MTTTEHDTAPRPRRFRKRFRWLLLGLPFALGGMAFAHRANAFGHGRWHGNMSDEEREEMFQHRVEWALDHLNATPQQKTQVKAILDRAKPDARQLHEQHRKLRKEMLDAMSADRVDPNRVEQLRKEAVTLMDRASTLASRTMIDVGNVLTPEQRKEVAGFMAKRMRF